MQPLRGVLMPCGQGGLCRMPRFAGMPRPLALPFSPLAGLLGFVPLPPL